MNSHPPLSEPKVQTVTILDSSFLVRGLTMAHSLLAFLPNARVNFVCLDKESWSFIQDLRDEKLRAFRVEEIGLPNSHKLRRERSRGEFAWTATPFSLMWASEIPESDISLYVDADFFFLQSPDLLLRDFWESSAQVLVTEHGYSPEHDGEALFGRFCVQFLAVKSSSELPTIQQWANQCIEWCFASADGTKFGDQKYLDVWPLQLGSHLKIARPTTLFVGPWNMRIADPNKALGFHFHGLRLVGPGQIKVGYSAYQVPRPYLTAVYGRYLSKMESIAGKVGLSGSQVSPRTKMQSAYRSTVRRILLSNPGLLSRMNRTVPTVLERL